MRLIDADKLMLSLNDNYLANCPIGNETLAVQDYRESLCEGLEIAMATVEGTPTVGGWISVKDRLPERKEYLHESNVIRNSSEYVLVYVSASFPYERMFVTVARYDYDKHWPRWVIRSSHDGVVTHWMPLPEPPKEVKQND